MPGCELDNEADKAFALEESTPESTVSQGSFRMLLTGVMSISVVEHLDGLSHPFSRVKRCYGTSKTICSSMSQLYTEDKG